MAAQRTVQIAGPKLADLRIRRLHMTQDELGFALGLTGHNVRRAEARDRVGMLVRNFRKLAELAKKSFDELAAQLAPEAQPPPAMVSREELESLASAIRILEAYPDEFLQVVSRIAHQRLPAWEELKKAAAQIEQRQRPEAPPPPDPALVDEEIGHAGQPPPPSVRRGAASESRPRR